MISVALWDCLFSLPLAGCFSHFQFFNIISADFLFSPLCLSSYNMSLYFALTQATVFKLFSPYFHPSPPSLVNLYCGVSAPHVETMTLIKLAQFYLWNADAPSEIAQVQTLHMKVLSYCSWDRNSLKVTFYLLVMQSHPWPKCQSGKYAVSVIECSPFHSLLLLSVESIWKNWILPIYLPRERWLIWVLNLWTFAEA